MPCSPPWLGATRFLDRRTTCPAAAPSPRRISISSAHSQRIVWDHRKDSGIKTALSGIRQPDPGTLSSRQRPAIQLTACNSSQFKNFVPIHIRHLPLRNTSAAAGSLDELRGGGQTRKSRQSASASTSGAVPTPDLRDTLTAFPVSSARFTLHSVGRDNLWSPELQGASCLI